MAGGEEGVYLVYARAGPVGYCSCSLCTKSIKQMRCASHGEKSPADDHKPVICDMRALESS